MFISLALEHRSVFSKHGCTLIVRLITIVPKNSIYCYVEYLVESKIHWKELWLVNWSKSTIPQERYEGRGNLGPKGVQGLSNMVKSARKVIIWKCENC